VTGDLVFAGDVGRPDLLERAVGVADAADGAARTLFRSLAWFRGLPEHLQVWPGHGAGSACGKGLSAMPQSTVGYEIRYNWAFGIADEDAFVAAVLSGQPDPPRYFREMKRINRDGPAPLRVDVRPDPLPAAELDAALSRGEMVVDIRTAESFAAGHVPGTVNLPRNRSFATWAGWLLPYDAPFHLLGDAASVREAARDLALIGLDDFAGWFGPEALDAWAAGGRDLQRSRRLRAEELRDAQAGGAVVLDVRNQDEWDAGHLPGSRLVPLGRLPERLNEIPRRQPVVVHCQGGSRCAIAASLLEAAGFTNVSEFGPGFSGWLAAGLPVERAS
jgi:hydroxyacylglutathione hydrolase